MIYRVCDAKNKHEINSKVLQVSQVRVSIFKEFELTKRIKRATVGATGKQRQTLMQKGKFLETTVFEHKNTFWKSLEELPFLGQMDNVASK